MIRIRHLSHRNFSRIRRSRRLLRFLQSVATNLTLSVPEIVTALKANKTARYLRNAKSLGICANEYGIPNNSLSSGSNQAAVYRTSCVLLRDVNRLRFVFGNTRLTATGEIAPADAVTYEASVETTANGGNPVRITFNNGSNTVTLAPGATIVSDEIPVVLPKNSRMYVRTRVSVDTLGKKWPTYKAMDTAIGEGFNSASNWVMDANPPSLSAAGGVGPVAVLSVDMDATSYVILGSSSAAGQGDTPDAPNYETGYLSRALTIAGQGHSSSAVPSDTIQKFLAGNAFRMQHIQDTRAEVVIFQLGGNDISNGRTFEQITSDLITAWALVRFAGVRIIQTDYTPTSTSTDSWATLENQTLPASAALRAQINAWLETQLYTGQIDTLVRISPIVTDEATGKWKVDGTANKFTVDGTHLSPYAHKLVANAIANDLY